MWDVFGDAHWVPRHVIQDIRPYENDSKNFLKTKKNQDEKPILPHLLG